MLNIFLELGFGFDNDIVCVNVHNYYVLGMLLSVVLQCVYSAVT